MCQKCDNCKGVDCPYSVHLMSNEELINTLLSRPTFLGIIIRSEEEVLPTSSHQNFLLAVNHLLAPEDLSDILLCAAENVRQTKDRKSVV
jgi:hypothetical protein